MKKSTLMLLVGIILLAVVVIADLIISNVVLDFSNPSNFGFEHYLSIVLATIILVAGIVLIIVSRRVARKEK